MQTSFLFKYVVDWTHCMSMVWRMIIFIVFAEYRTAGKCWWRFSKFDRKLRIKFTEALELQVAKMFSIKIFSTQLLHEHVDYVSTKAKVGKHARTLGALAAINIYVLTCTINSIYTWNKNDYCFYTCNEILSKELLDCTKIIVILTAWMKSFSTGIFLTLWYMSILVEWIFCMTVLLISCEAFHKSNDNFP